MRTRPCFVGLRFAFFCLAFITEGRLFDPTTIPDDRSSSSESERLSKALVTPRCKLPPFLPPFALSDSAAFEVISSCPFHLHKQVTGYEIDGCFPMYNIPNWDDSNSNTYEVSEFNREKDSHLVLEKMSTFATSEEFNLGSTPDASNLGECATRMNFKVEGINGEISGGQGTTSLVAIVVSFQEHDKENTVLIPIGGCESHIRRSGRHEKLKDSCSIRPTSIERNECLGECYMSIESNYIDEIDKLTVNRQKRISKNDDNKEIVLGKLIISRANKMSTAFARCRCKHIEQDLGQCFLRVFLDALVSENEHQFEVKEDFNHHMDEIETWFQNNRQLICDASTNAALNCRDEC